MNKAAPNLSDAKRELLARMMRGEAAKAAPAPAIPKRDPGAVVPLSAAQRQVWIHAGMAPDVPIYNESFTFHRHGSFDRGAMEAALRAVVHRHEAWRTSFVADGDVPSQRINETVSFDIPFDDVGHLPEAERDAAAIALATRDAQRPIDMAAPPLLRIRIVRLADDAHRIYFTLHHIIFDGVAIYRVILPELAALYDAFVAGKPDPLPPLAIDYGDYAIWHADHLGSPAIQRQIDHWRDLLADAPPKLDLPTDRPRPRRQSHAGAMETFTIPLALTERLKTLAQAQGVTLYMVLLAGFTALLHRHSQAEDIVLGGVTDLRRRPEVDRMVGYFLNTFALRSKPKAALNFAEHLTATRDIVVGALGVSEVPFDELVQALDLRRGEGAHPLFNVLFSIQPAVDPFPAGWDLTQMDVPVAGAKFDLYLELEERPEGVSSRFLYSTELFDAPTIRRWADRWIALLDAAVADTGLTLAELPVLADADLALIAAANATEKPLPGWTVPQAIADQARQRPGATALRFAGRDASYAELDARADAIAAAVAHLGHGALVGLYLDRSPDLVAAMIGVLRAGCAYLPLDPKFPAARIGYILEDGDAAAVLTSRALTANLSQGAPIAILVDDISAPESPAGAPLRPDDLAYVLYTSGSTGRPKGVEISHGALANLLASFQANPGFTVSDTLLAVTTVSFDIAALELFLPLVSGGTIILAEADEVRDPDALISLIANEKPSIMQATPATWGALIEAGWDGDPALTILCGGEAMPRSLANKLRARCGTLWNVYGPTETTIWSTVARVPSGDGPVPIGVPLDNTVVRLLDAAHRPVPPGATGELWIGGAGLARGYRGRPDLTAERFVTIDGERLYRTGDLARQRGDGTLLCLGRVDADEKIRGYRVSVEEVEGALATHPAIAAAAVRGIDEPGGTRALGAWLVARGDERPAIEALHEHLAATLPHYMLPGRVMWLDALPLTPNAKVDRRALPDIDGDAAPASVPPQGPDEEKLAAIWADLLGTTAIGRDDSFLSLGGHSLLVARLVRRIEAGFEAKLTIADIFRYPRLAEMAALLRDGEAARPDALVIPIQPLGSKPPLLWLEGGPNFLPLATRLGTDQPFLGFFIQPILAAQPPGASFDQVAQAVCDAIRAAMPGPYRVGGWCTAGLLAWAVAGKLRAAGEEVPLVLMAHAMNPTEHEHIGRARLFSSKLAYHLRQLMRPQAGGRWRYLNARIGGIIADLASINMDGGPDPEIRREDMLDRAAYVYRPSAYAGRVVLIQPVERAKVLDAAPGWMPLAKAGIEVHEIPGAHSTMMKPPHVDAMAACIAGVLAGGR